MNTSTTALKTDFYEITMLQAALMSGHVNDPATFELFARKLPAGRKYGVVAGVSRCIDAITNFHFTDEQLTYIASNSVILPETIDFLKNYRFSGNVEGLVDGDLYFPYTPILTVQGTFADCVLLETVLLSILNHDSAVASAASRMVQAVGDKPIIEMGSRRTHDEAAVDSALAAYISGFTATSNMEAGMRYGIPITGTSAHAYTLLHENEKDAFRNQVNALGVGTTLLVDTYDIEQGIRNAVEVAGPELGAIRIDSGDLHQETMNARKLLDSLGATKTRIILSSDIDEYTISELNDQGTPYDGIGAGTRVVTGSGHPTAGMVYKLVERFDKNTGKMLPVAKKASGKKSVGGRKFLWNIYENGLLVNQVYTFSIHFPKIKENQTARSATSTLILNGKDNGQISHAMLSRVRHLEVMRELPAEVKDISAGEPYITVEEAK